MPYSLTYIAILALTFLGVENAQEVAQAGMIIVVALIGIYGRFRAGGVNIFGIKK